MKLKRKLNKIKKRVSQICCNVNPSKNCRQCNRPVCNLHLKDEVCMTCDNTIVQYYRKRSGESLIFYQAGRV